MKKTHEQSVARVRARIMRVMVTMAKDAIERELDTATQAQIASMDSFEAILARTEGFNALCKCFFNPESVAETTKDSEGFLKNLSDRLVIPPITIPPTDGSKTIVGAGDDLFNYVDAWGKRNNGARSGENLPTKQATVSVHELVKNGDLSTIIKSASSSLGLGGDLESLSLTENQITSFVPCHRWLLAPEGSFTFFLSKCPEADGGFRVTGLIVFGNTLGAYDFPFTYKQILDVTTHKHRFVFNDPRFAVA